jgi:hypothetical protein
MEPVRENFEQWSNSYVAFLLPSTCLDRTYCHFMLFIVLDRNELMTKFKFYVVHLQSSAFFCMIVFGGRVVTFF